MISIAHNGIPEEFISAMSELVNISISIDNPDIQPNILVLYNVTPEEIKIRTSLFKSPQTDIVVISDDLSSLRTIGDLYDTGISLLFESSVDSETFKAGLAAMVSSNVYNSHLFVKHSSCVTTLADQLSFDEGGRVLFIKGVIHRLNPKEFELMQILCENLNSCVSKRSLLLTLWGNDSTSSSRSFDVYINRLRCLFDDFPAVDIINSKRTNGSGGRILTTKHKPAK